MFSHLTALSLVSSHSKAQAWPSLGLPRSRYMLTHPHSVLVSYSSNGVSSSYYSFLSSTIHCKVGDSRVTLSSSSGRIEHLYFFAKRHLCRYQQPACMVAVLTSRSLSTKAPTSQVSWTFCRTPDPGIISCCFSVVSDYSPHQRRLASKQARTRQQQ